ncbi:hypothetical protein [Phytopseudomonas flavescens]|uniref:hypothetical protein n=1 Tax=Phytopseudomonas flavescens TaxID=29435 RepID=UPI0011143F51|nr:hypothetical protein [Pseudomonas flavescens]
MAYSYESAVISTISSGSRSTAASILSGDRASCQQIIDANYVSYSGLGKGFLPVHLSKLFSNALQVTFAEVFLAPWRSAEPGHAGIYARLCVSVLWDGIK